MGSKTERLCFSSSTAEAFIIVAFCLVSLLEFIAVVNISAARLNRLAWLNPKGCVCTCMWTRLIHWLVDKVAGIFADELTICVIQWECFNVIEVCFWKFEREKTLLVQVVVCHVFSGKLLYKPLIIKIFHVKPLYKPITERDWHSH